MIGRNILMYFPWSRPDEEGAPLGTLDNRFGALFELHRLQWPKYEALADIERFNQGIAGFLAKKLIAKGKAGLNVSEEFTGPAGRALSSLSSQRA
jgi:hypothetical protein